MKHILITLLFVTLLFVFAALPLSSEETTSKVSVTTAEINNGVVILTVRDGGSRLELQCNAVMPNCKKVDPGKYTMVRLEKGHGMYECDNVELYSGETQTDQRLGQYCAIRP